MIKQIMEAFFFHLCSPLLFYCNSGTNKLVGPMVSMETTSKNHFCWHTSSDFNIIKLCQDKMYLDSS